MYKKYAQLLSNYCLQVKKGDKVYIQTTYLAEPLLQELLREITRLGGHLAWEITIQEEKSIFFKEAQTHQLQWINPLYKEAIKHFDCYLAIIAPFNLKENQGIDTKKQGEASKAKKELSNIYMQRTGAYDLRRSLCMFPTQANAQEASMSLSAYQDFVFNACNLYTKDPISEWEKVGKNQQAIVDYLNNCTQIQYKGEHIDISFSTQGRKWINSDGKTNMPSGEVYTAPVENSVNGHVRFTYPSIYKGVEVEDIELEVKNGEVVNWKAKRGQKLLDEVFKIPGAKHFGEAAIGTNFNINRFTKNILFDEKIGGTIHMAIGQSYMQCGGKNNSTIHWDMICDMSQDGQIFADGECIYKKGHFLLK